MTHTIRFCFDRLCRAGIKLAMLTGVAFTMTACYGVPPEKYYSEDEAFKADTQKVEQQLGIEETQTAE